MKKCLLFILILASIESFGARAVVEVGRNVQVNTLSKIEQARATVEAIKQTKNQIIQLKNDALNLNKWTTLALEETLGITQEDINGILSLKRETEALINDIVSLQKEWNKSEWNKDFTKLSEEELARSFTEQNLKLDSEFINLKKTKERLNESINNVKVTAKLYNDRNKAIHGNLEAAQLLNEIAANTNAEVKNLTNYLKQKEITEIERKGFEKKLESVNQEYRIRGRIQELNYFNEANAISPPRALDL